MIADFAPEAADCRAGALHAPALPELQHADPYGRRRRGGHVLRFDELLGWAGASSARALRLLAERCNSTIRQYPVHQRDDGQPRRRRR